MIQLVSKMRYHCGGRLKSSVVLIAGAALFLSSLFQARADNDLADSVKEHPPQLLVVFIGGIDSDPTPAQIAGTAQKNQGNSGMFQLCGEFSDDRIVCEYFNWNGTRAGQIDQKKPPFAEGIVQRIREHIRQNPRGKTAIVGNSWGGHTAWQAAAQLRNSELPLVIDRMIFLDPSSAGRAVERRPKFLPINVKQAINYHTRNLYCWGAWEGDRIGSVDLGDPALGFSQNGRPAYASKFDISAHVAAEWDPQIHAQIKTEILRLLPSK